MSPKLEKAMAEKFAADVRLRSLVMEGNPSPEVDEKGLRKLAKHLTGAGPAADGRLAVCSETLLDKGSHWSVRAAAISEVNSWFNEELRTGVVAAPGTRAEAAACLSQALDDENALVRETARTVLDTLKGGGDGAPSEPGAG